MSGLPPKQSLQLTGAAILFSRDIKLLQRPRQVSWVVRRPSGAHVRRSITIAAHQVAAELLERRKGGTISRATTIAGREAGMDRETFTETIRAFKHRTPFKPFTVATVSGNRYEVDYPDALAVREGLAIFVGPGRVPVFFDYDGVSKVIGDLAGRGAETG